MSRILIWASIPSSPVPFFLTKFRSFMYLCLCATQSHYYYNPCLEDKELPNQQREEAPQESSHCRFAAQYDMKLTEHPGCFRATKWSNVAVSADVKTKGLLYLNSKYFLCNCVNPGKDLLHAKMF